MVFLVFCKNIKNINFLSNQESLAKKTEVMCEGSMGARRLETNW